MKTIATIFLGVLLLSSIAMAQNRITTWDTGKITAIRAEFTSNNDSIYVTDITTNEAMDSVLTFLRQTEFREYSDKAREEINTNGPWIIRLSFTGQRDQILFWEDHATIGKTLFIIDKKVVRELKKIITHCKKC